MKVRERIESLEQRLINILKKIDLIWREVVKIIVLTLVC